MEIPVSKTEWPLGSLRDLIADQSRPIAALQHVDLVFRFLANHIAKNRLRLGRKVVEEPAPGQPIIALLVDVPDFDSRPRAIHRDIRGLDFQNIPLNYRPGRPDYPRIN